MASGLRQTVGFLTRVKLKAMFLGDDALWMNLLRGGALLFVIAYGAYYGYLLDAMVDSYKVDISFAQADILLQMLVLSMIVFVNYFPGYRPSGRFIRETYPITRTFRLVSNNIHDLLHLYYLYTFVFIFAVWWMSSYVDWRSALALFVGFAGAVFTERAAKLFIEQEMKQVAHNLALWVILPVTLGSYFFIGYWLEPDVWTRLILSIVWTLVAWTVYVYLDAQIVQPKTRKNATARTESRWQILGFEQRLFLRRKSVRPLVLILPLLKVLAILYGYLMGGELFENREHWTILYAGFLMLPISPFTYVQNNLAGFFRETWISHELMNGRPQELLRAWWTTLWPMLAYDAACTGIAMGAAGILTVDYAAMWIASALIMIPIGIYGSMTQARHIAHFLSIQNITSFKNNTSTRIILLDTVSILILGAMYVMGWILYALPFVVLITALLLWRIRPMYVARKHRMYQKLFKEG